MIVEYIRYELKQHQPDALIAAYREAGLQLQAAPQCLGYDLSHCLEEPASLTCASTGPRRKTTCKAFERDRISPPSSPPSGHLSVKSRKCGTTSQPMLCGKAKPATLHQSHPAQHPTGFPSRNL
ncbi:MAG TPA: hypothetical protein VGO22_03010 [Pseudorhizobium sp.]|jgi:hypothetical protein|nr:hypothetical protein [Pseudorhizobium sp.]